MRAARPPKPPWWRSVAGIVMASVYAILGLVVLEIATEAIASRLGGGLPILVLSVAALVAVAVEVIRSRLKPTREARPSPLGEEPAYDGWITRPVDGAPEDALQRYAELAGQAAEALSPAQPAQERNEAVQWFRSEAPGLLKLLCAPPPPSQATAPLWQLAEALDLWFAHENRLADRQAAAEAFDAAADRLGDTAARQTAQLRLSAIARLAGRLDGSEHHLAEADRLAGVPGHRVGRSQLRSGWALHHLATGDLARAEDEIFQSQNARSHHDQVGQIIDQLNVAVVLLRRRRLDDARGHLHAALDLAEDCGDLAGQAQAHELLGVLAALRDSPDPARRSWGEAQWRYEQLADDAGRARCLLHLGSVRPSRPVDADKDRREAKEILLRSLQLRAGQSVGLGVALAHLHLAEIAAHGRWRRDMRSHAERARLALAPWDDRAIRPDEVRAILDRLDRLRRR